MVYIKKRNEEEKNPRRLAVKDYERNYWYMKCDGSGYPKSHFWFLELVGILLQFRPIWLTAASTDGLPAMAESKATAFESTGGWCLLVGLDVGQKGLRWREVLELEYLGDASETCTETPLIT